MSKQMMVLTKKVDEGLVLTRINGELEGMQNFVGGLIERVGITESIDLICDEEFLFKDYQPNIKVEGDYSEVVIHGDCFFAKHDGMGEYIDLTEADVNHLFKQVKIMGYSKQ
jgi:Domain of unknown function (DUF3846)